MWAGGLACGAVRRPAGAVYGALYARLHVISTARLPAAARLHYRADTRQRGRRRCRRAVRGESSISTMKSVRCRHAVDAVVTLLMLFDSCHASPSSSLNYCHRLDDHPPRLYATKTAYDEVRARDLETQKLVVGADNSSSSSNSDVSGTSQHGITDHYFGQR